MVQWISSNVGKAFMVLSELRKPLLNSNIPLENFSRVNLTFTICYSDVPTSYILVQYCVMHVGLYS